MDKTPSVTNGFESHSSRYKRKCNLAGQSIVFNSLKFIDYLNSL